MIYRICNDLENITSKDVFVIDTDTMNMGQGSTSSIDADLSVTKIDSPDFVKLGEQFYYTMKVENKGPSIATNITLLDILPLGIELIDVSLNKGNYSEKEGVIACKLGDIVKDEVVTVIITVKPITTGTLCNRVMVMGKEKDSNTFNNEFVDCTTVIRTICIEAEKVVDACRELITKDIEFQIPPNSIDEHILCEVTDTYWEVVSISETPIQEFMKVVITIWVDLKLIIDEGSNTKIFTKIIDLTSSANIRKSETSEITCDISEIDCQTENGKIIVTLNTVIKSIEKQQIEIPYIKVFNPRPC